MPALKLPMTTILTALMYVSLSSGAVMAFQSVDEFEKEPILYSKSTPTNRVAELKAAIDAGEKTLEKTAEFGYLPDLLKALEVLWEYSRQKIRAVCRMGQKAFIN